MTVQATETRPLTMRMTFSDGLRHTQLNLLVDTVDGLLFMFEAGGHETKLRYGGSSRGVIGFERVDVLRINYNSPLEIVLGFSAGVGAVAFAANRILSVYRNVQEARIKRAEADVAAYTRDLITREFRLDQELLEAADPKGLRLGGAVRAVQTMTSASIQPADN